MDDEIDGMDGEIPEMDGVIDGMSDGIDVGSVRDANGMADFVVLVSDRPDLGRF